MIDFEVLGGNQHQDVAKQIEARALVYDLFSTP
jgi:hypothetical protein